MYPPLVSMTYPNPSVMRSEKMQINSFPTKAGLWMDRSIVVSYNETKIKEP